MKWSINLYYLSAYLFLFSGIQQAGFGANTIVISAGGPVAIQDLKKTDLVVSSNQGDLCLGEVSAAKSFSLSHQVRIVLGRSEIVCDVFQLFYLPILNEWQCAGLLKPGMCLLNINNELVEIVSVNKENSFNKVHGVEIENEHNLFVTNESILVHNGVPLFVIGVSWAFGSGALEYVGTTVTFGLLGWFLERNNSSGSGSNRSSSSGAGGGLGQEPDDDDKDHKISASQAQQLVKKGQCPNTIKRIDKGGTPESPHDHAHFKDGSALYRNGTWRHGFRQLTGAEKAFLSKIGFSGL